MRARWLSIVLVFLFITSTSAITLGSETNSTDPVKFDFNSTKEFGSSYSDKLQGQLETYTNTGYYPSDNFTGRLMVLSKNPLTEFSMVVPPIKVGQHYLNFIPRSSPEIVRNLALRNDVGYILPDLKINFESVKPNPSISTDSFQAKEILRTGEVWSEFGINGTGVKVGITDSGVDFGSSELTDAAYMDPQGYTASFDPTGSGVGLAGLEVSPYTKDGKRYLPLSGKNITYWEGERQSLSNTANVGITLEDLEITDIPVKSVSGRYHVGISFQLGLTQEQPDQYFLFVLADSKNAFEYDTMYVDFSTSLALTLVQNGLILPASRTYISLVDWSLNDEEPFNADNPILAKDLNGDGINDVSMGALGTVLDLNLVSNVPIIHGIDISGNAIGVIYDSVGHGTSTSSAVAARGIADYLVYDDISTEKIENNTSYKLPGSAPGAKIIATKGITLNDFILGWFWTAGLELTFSDNQISWVEDQSHLVDISSNSWGSGEIAYENTLKGMDFYSLFADFLSTPESLYTGYPGVLYVISSGNGAPGFGTAARPGMSSMAITVGASTYYHFLNGSKGRNDIAWFSSRGPTPYGDIKPDIVAPGHTGFLPKPVITGLGNGTYARGIFGGTSEAAPRIAGVIALMFEAMKNKGINPNLEITKLTLQSTARDLSFHTTQQGAGLADAYRAVSSIIRSDQVLISNDITSQVIGQRLQNAFRYQFGSDLDHPLVTNPIEQYSLIATPAQLESGITVHLRYQNGTAVPTSKYSVAPQQYKLAVQGQVTLTSSNTKVTRNIGNQLPTGWKNTGLLELSAVLTQSSYSALTSNGLGTPELYLRDSQSDRVIADTLSELTWTQMLYSGNPSDDFSGDPVIEFNDPGFQENINAWQGLTYNIGVRGFSQENWTNIDLVDNSGSVTVDGSVPKEDNFGSLLYSFDSLDQRVPIYLSHIYPAQKTQTLDYAGQNLQETGPLNPNLVLGALDLGYRPESGDFRFYQISVPSNATYLAIYGRWDQSGLIPDFWLFNSSGYLLRTSDVSYVGNGAYRSTTSENYSQNIFVPSTDTNYILLVHFAQVPFTPGPYNFRLYARYLDLPGLPQPKPKYSQSLDLPITGNFSIDASNYSVSQFPELRIDNVYAQIYQGRSGNFTETIDQQSLKEGPASLDLQAGDFDTFFTADFSAGEIVDLALKWKGDADVDIYVFSAQSSLDRKNDLLHGLGTSPGTGYEYGRFAVDADGLYVFYIDYVGGLDNQNLDLLLQYDSRKGPILTDDAPNITIPTEIFPNGGFGLRLVFITNFNVYFETYSDIILVNHDTFTFQLDSPTDGEEVSGNVQVSWTASTGIAADVLVIQDGVSVMVGRNILTNEFTFDSKEFANGPALIQVEASDGVYSASASVSVQFNNDFPSTLPKITTTTNRNLPGLLFMQLFAMWTLIVLLRRKIDR